MFLSRKIHAFCKQHQAEICKNQAKTKQQLKAELLLSSFMFSFKDILKMCKKHVCLF